MMTIDPDLVAFINEMNAWLKATGTNYTGLCAAAGVHTHIRFAVENGRSVKAEHIRAIRDAMRANPNGVAPPPRKSKIGNHPSDNEIQRRADAVRQERERRVRELLANEKPGLNGQRRSMRPIWEMRA